MKKSILKLSSSNELSKTELKKIKGEGGCCNPNSPWGIQFPRACASLPPCEQQ